MRDQYGDFQTPETLADAVCRLIQALRIQPASLLEPTCGVGTFLKAGVSAFAPLRAVRGFERNAEYVREARSRLFGIGSVDVVQANFFEQDWPSIVRDLPQPVLILGNPPWITNADVGAMGGANLPEKSNLSQRRGLDAKTGKSNFDISEYMLIQLTEAMQRRSGAFAMLCKTSVARKVLAHAWSRQLQIGDCRIFPIDAQESFGAAVAASLFVASFDGRVWNGSCKVHSELRAESDHVSIAYKGDVLVADADLFERRRELQGRSDYRWRSGIKHDCAKVMEFSESSDGLRNGFGEIIDMEPDFLYPLLKSSSVAGSENAPKRWILVTERKINEDTAQIANIAPRTWGYLLKHANRLDQRASSIYRNRPRFAIFGVGPYSFALWKVAISGLHKNLSFRVVGPRDERPAMLDDTSYFLACRSQDEAACLASALNAAEAQEFYRSLIFWDAKRPITVEILSQLKVEKLASICAG